MTPLSHKQRDRLWGDGGPYSQIHHWGELHKVFIPEGQMKTFTEMTEVEMDSWRAGRYEDWCGRQFARWLKENRLK